MSNRYAPMATAEDSGLLRVRRLKCLRRSMGLLSMRSVWTFVYSFLIGRGVLIEFRSD
ncbi:hypothetical protein K503DRAFT_774375 [Rhizopogon vinicolor AM-OR11-026]|uniref:Uncharacterized protein n=1 Tax=Rhizopogon vinicolor AM-OR11-026 TaxID=1314800 RepID=A0A1B7MPR5_9AGAM|nr:hypothetical protein K503DRAFT_774375 [Rhizopogon vinicolor AM-OR11-026]